ncbi:MAG: hypothetical protein WB996_09620 [Ignavibacteriaceae bacterium]
MDSNLFTKYSLPSYFKIIGLVVILISLLVLVFAAFIKSYLVFFPASNIILMYNRISFLCGLSLVVFSREREEDDETDKARLVALIFSMAASVLLLVVIEIINVFNNNSPIYAIDFMIIEMCLYYIIFKFNR